MLTSACPSYALEFVELDLGHGLRLFNNYCVNCHNHDGTGSAVAKEAFSSGPPILLERADATPAQYYTRILHGGPNMAPMDWELSQRDVWDIVYALPLLRQSQPLFWQKKYFKRWIKQ
ncbi:MAG: cytochrome c [Mariprofundaceae bacterium]|nr:cytochrome c [Mariprofundaceae bacterium]